MLEELIKKGAILNNIKIACLECGSSQLNKLGQKWSTLEIYTTKVNSITDNSEATKEQVLKDNFLLRFYCLYSFEYIIKLLV